MTEKKYKVWPLWSNLPYDKNLATPSFYHYSTSKHAGANNK